MDAIEEASGLSNHGKDFEAFGVLRQEIESLRGQMRVTNSRIQEDARSYERDQRLIAQLRSQLAFVRTLTINQIVGMGLDRCECSTADPVQCSVCDFVVEISGMRKPLPSPSAEARRECANCPEPESVHGIGGYYCEFKAMPTPAPSPSVEREVPVDALHVACVERDRLREELAWEWQKNDSNAARAFDYKKSYEKAESDLAQVKKDLSDNQIVLDANRLLGGGTSLYDGYEKAHKDLEAKTEECESQKHCYKLLEEERKRLHGECERLREAVGVFMHHWKHGGIARNNQFHQQTHYALLAALAPRAEKPSYPCNQCGFNHADGSPMYEIHRAFSANPQVWNTPPGKPAGEGER